MQENPTNVVGRRVLAFLVDTLIVWAVIALLWILFTDRLDADTTTGGGFVIGDTRYGFHEDSSGKRGAWGILSFLVGAVIYGVLPGLRGTSPGRALMKIRVVKRDGQVPGLGRGLLRWLILMIIDLSIIGLVVMLVRKDHQRLGDMAAGTYTVKAEDAGKPVELGQPGPGPIGYGYVPPPTYAGPSPSAPPPPPAQSGPAPGWYDDPQGQARLRWWDGQRWTDQTSA